MARASCQSKRPGSQRSALLSLLLFLVAPPLPGHKEYPLAPGAVLADADAIVRAKVVEAELDRARCYSSWTFQLETVARLRGEGAPERFTFSYDVFFPRKAEYPWQKDCPSVHYTRPPVAPNMQRGAEVVATLKKDKRGRWQATGTLSPEEYARNQK